jgi:hypothetical protein
MKRFFTSALVAAVLLLGSFAPKADAQGLRVSLTRPTGCTGSLCTSLTVYYKLADTADEINSHTLTNNNSVTFVTGHMGNAAHLVSSSLQYLSLADTADVSSGDIDYTGEIWVKLASIANEQTIVGKDEAGQREYRLYFNQASDAFTYDIFKTGSSTSVSAGGGSITTNVWYHVFFWHDSVNDLIGIAYGSESLPMQTAVTTSYSGGSDDTTAPLNLGRRSYASFEGYCDCDLDGFGFRKKVLSSGERDASHNSNAGLEYPYSVL